MAGVAGTTGSGRFVLWSSTVRPTMPTTSGINPVHGLTAFGEQVDTTPLTMRAVRWHRRYQQFVCGWLLLLADNTVPSLVVIEQLSLLNDSKLDASIEPTSDADTGVSVIVHGM
jgi:hypothetical protein